MNARGKTWAGGRGWQYCIALGCLLFAPGVQADTRASAHYGLTTESVNSGGGRSVSAHYVSDADLGNISGASTSMVQRLEYGYAAQLNNPPVPGPTPVLYASNALARIAVGTLLANDSDPDGDRLTLAALDAFSARGGTVVLANGWVVYTPSSGFVGTDSFSYKVADANGDRTVCSVTVEVSVAGRSILMISKLANGHKVISLFGLSGQTYTLQRKLDSRDANWSNLVTGATGLNGRLDYEDATGDARRMYRAISNQ
jgi:hypothetical protein